MTPESWNRHIAFLKHFAHQPQTMYVPGTMCEVINCRCATMPAIATDNHRPPFDSLLEDISAEWRAQAIVVGHVADAGPR